MPDTVTALIAHMPISPPGTVSGATQEFTVATGQEPTGVARLEDSDVATLGDPRAIGRDDIGGRLLAQKSARVRAQEGLGVSIRCGDR